MSNLREAAQRLVIGLRQPYYQDVIDELIQEVEAALESEPADEASMLRVELAFAARTFRNYESLHLAKGTEEGIRKAEDNASLARRFERFPVVGVSGFLVPLGQTESARQPAPEAAKEKP